MVYADLDDLSRPQMPVFTSPKPLPPIKRRQPYRWTEYADISQFRKGEASLPGKSQSTELQLQGANTDGGGGELNKTAMWVDCVPRLHTPGKSHKQHK